MLLGGPGGFGCGGGAAASITALKLILGFGAGRAGGTVAEFSTKLSDEMLVLLSFELSDTSSADDPNSSLPPYLPGSKSCQGTFFVSSRKRTARLDLTCTVVGSVASSCPGSRFIAERGSGFLACSAASAGVGSLSPDGKSVPPQGTSLSAVHASYLGVWSQKGLSFLSCSGGSTPCV